MKSDEARETAARGELDAAQRPAADMLVVDDLAKAYGGVRAVDGVTFRVPAGAMAGLIGPNGAGKSTVLGMIAGAIRPDRGEILLDGNAVRLTSPVKPGTAAPTPARPERRELPLFTTVARRRAR